MKTNKRPFVFLLTILLVLSLACSSLSELSATATPLPTSTFTPSPTITPTPEEPVTTTVNSAGDLKLSDKKYEHPNGLASFYPMEGWDIEETDYSVSMSHPETGVTYYLSVTNTGYELDADAYKTFRLNREEIYTVNENYKEIDSGENPDIQLYYVEKTYRGFDGENYYAYSFYQQFGNVIYTIELYGKEAFVQADANNPYRIMFDAFSQTINVKSKTASKYPLYQDSWTYVSPQTGATLTIPLAWGFEVLEESGSYMAVFNSPDGKASARLFTGASVKATGEVAKKFGRDATLAFLTGLTGDEGIQIISENGQVQEYAPGVYMFGWEAPAAGWTGVALYDTNHSDQNQIVITVVFSETASLDIYLELLGRIGDSYTSGQ